MEKSIKLLTALLVLQMLAAVGLGLTDRGLSAGSQTGPLLEVDGEKVDRITLEGPDGAKVVLANKDGRWQLPDAGGFPADGDRVRRLIDRLSGLQAGTPVATSDEARRRFKVGEEAFERRITLARGDQTLATLYLGSSPGMKRIHARTGDQEAIHVVELAAYQVPVSADDWRDKALLSLPSSEIAAIEIDGLRIERAGKAGDEQSEGTDEEPAWTASPLPEGKRLKVEAADKLVRRLADLRFEKVLGKEPKPEYGLEQPLLELEVTRKEGETIRYRLGKAPEKEAYTLKVSSRPEYFRLASFVAKPLIEAAAREALLAPAVTGAEQQRDGAAEQARTKEPQTDAKNEGQVSSER